MPGQNTLAKEPPIDMADAAPAQAGAAPAQAGAAVLKPISHPQLQPIRIEDELFAIGRNEAPFCDYPGELVADLSRRHARIFMEDGALYVADLGSKNGTTVNGVEIRQQICRLQQDDVIGFGRNLDYRVQLGSGMHRPARAARLAALALSPESPDSGLQPIVVTQFPFLISKADETFARYKESHAHQVTYLSRRHAHIFLKHGTPYLEDLGSTNGSYVNGKRLDEHAVPLKEGDTVAFGGHHFVYKVALQTEQPQTDLTMTRFSPVPAAPREKGPAAGAPASATPAAGAGPAGVTPADADKTTFVAAAGSFLDIFCVDQPQASEEEDASHAADAAQEKGQEAKKPPRRGKLALFLAEVKAVLRSDQPDRRSSLWRWGAAAVAAVLAVAGLVLYQGQTPENELKDLLEQGQYAQAATVAEEYLARHGDHAEVKALGTEAVLKAYVPNWLGLIGKRQFDQAGEVLSQMRLAGASNGDVQLMAGELEWMGRLERFLAGRSNTAPIHIYSDEEAVNALLQHWNEDTAAHQRVFAKIASYVPQFGEPYAQALSRLRRLQSDDAVYLAAIARLKSTIDTELNRDQPEALEPVLAEYAEKYPRIGGMDALKADLRRYLDLNNALRNENTGELVAAMANARFTTPPFQARLRSLSEGRRLPDGDVVRQYQEADKAWSVGNTQQALAMLQQMAATPAGKALTGQLEHKKAVAEQFAALQSVRGGPAYEERLFNFYTLLDADEDAWFVRAIAPDLAQYKEKGLQRAQQALRKAQGQWQRYVESGGMAAGQRLEPQISPQFKAQAQLLAGANNDAWQGMRLYRQLSVEAPAEWRKLQEEITAEAEQQRRSLRELRPVLEPGLLKAKLALLGTPGR